MKRFVALLLPFLILPNATADVVPSNFVVSKEKILLIGNLEKNGFAQIESGPQIQLTGPTESFVSAASVDSDGNFLVFGSGAVATTINNPPASAPLNPDNVVVAPQSISRGNATQIWRWKISTSGEVLEAKGVEVGMPVWVKSAYGNLVAGSVATETGIAGFYLNWDGVTSKLNLIGKNSSEVNVVLNNNYLAGSSAEKLFGKNLAAKRDGILFKISKPNLVRSSNLNAERRWISGTSNYFLGGSAVVGKKTEAVVTKFTSNFAPTWTARFPAIGPAKVVAAKKNFIAAFATKGGKISIITFDSRGKIIERKSIIGSEISAFGYSDELGAVILVDGSLNRLTSR